MEYLISAFSILVEELSLINLCNSFCTKRLSNRNIILLSILTTTFILILTQTYFKYLTLPKSLIIVLINLSFVFVAYDKNYGGMLLSVIVQYILVAICDFISIISITKILNISFGQIFSSVSTFITTTAISKFLVFIITYFFEKIWLQNKLDSNISYQEWVLMLIFPSVSFIVLIVLVYTSIVSNQSIISTIAIIAGIFCANISTLTIISRLSANHKVAQDNAVLSQQIKQSMQNVESLISLYESQRRLTHDFDNHIQTLSTLISNGDFETAAQYLHRIEKSSKILPTVIKTNNPITDAILNYKYSIMMKKGITVDFDINDLSSMPISNEDLVSVLGNAIDNAIEACEKCVNEKRIKIKIRRSVYETIISIHNAINEKVVIKNNDVQTSKNNKLQHGYGLKNIKNILEKYDHTFILYSDEHWFQLTIIFV